MPILAIECSGVSTSVGIFDGDVPIVTAACDRGSGAAEDLAPHLREVLASLDDGGSAGDERRAAAPVDWIGVTAGPGSFTGLRVGLATAKTMAYAWSIPLVAVDTLHAIAWNAARTLEPGVDFWVVPVMNAFRKQVFAAVWHCRNGGPMTEVHSTQVMDVSAWANGPVAAFGLTDAWEAMPSPPRIVLTGPGFPFIQHAADTPLAAGVEVTDSKCWDPSVESVNAIAQLHAANGRLQTAVDLLPNYVRRSAAEEKAAQKD